MSSVDQRVVEMKFNSSTFAKGIADTLASLTKLQDALKLDGASKGAQDAATGMSILGERTGFLGTQYTALQTVAVGALMSIGNRAVQVGTQVAKSLTIAPVMQGFQEYETNMNSIQTILANTSAAGTNLSQVNAALDELNTYSDQTIYNFSEMARNIGTFTAAGVDLKTATGSIKGIANLAAVSGSNSQQAAGAMYQLSQAISSGKVSLMDWNSVVNAGMGGTVFQRALAQTAVNMGTLSDGSVKLTGDMKNVSIAGKSFRDSIDATNGPSWLTSDVLTQTLNQFTGDLTDAELAAKGYTQEQIKAIQAQADMAKKAATEVKTFSGLMDTLKEGVASGWSTTFRLLVGDFEESKKLFTSISNAVGGFLGGIAKRRNEMLAEWKLAGGRDVLLQGLKDALTAVFALIKPIMLAFRQIFPPTTAATLLSMTKSFAAWAATLQPSVRTVVNLRKTFAGLFAIISIVWQFIKAGVGFFTELFGTVTEGSGGILSFTARIGEFLVALNAAIKTGDVFGKFFDKLAAIVKVPIEMIKDLIGWVGKLFEGMSKSEAADSFGDIFDPISEAGNRLEVIGDRILKVLKAIREAVGNFVNNAKSWIAENLGGLFDGVDFQWNADTIMKALGLAGGVGLGALLIKALNGIKGAIGNFSLLGKGGEGMLASVKDALDGLSGTLQGMQQNLKANALLKIAGAIGIMAISVLVLSGIPADGLIRASVAMAAMMGILAGGLKALDKATGFFGAPKLAVLAFALIGLAAAVLILSFAMRNFASLSWEDLAKGVSALIALLLALAGAAKLMEGKNQAMVKTGASLMLLAIAVKILASAVKDLSELGWEELAKGIGGVAVLLGALGLFSRFAEANKAGLSNGAGIVLLAVAIKLLASAVGDFAAYNWEELAQGMVGIGVGLGILAGALWLIPAEKVLAKGAAIALIAWSLKFMADAISVMAELGWVDMAKGLIVMNMALGAIVRTLDNLPKDALGKAVAVLAVAVALKVVASALADIGSIPFGDLIKGLLGLTVSLAAIAFALVLMEKTTSGAIALLIASVALTALAVVLQMLGSMSWSDILAGLGALAGIFLVLGIATLVLAPLAPVLLVIGIAIGLLGVGVMLAAAGVLLFATALTVLAAAGSAGASALGVILTTFIGLIPVIMAALAAGIIAFASVIVAGAPVIFAAFTAIMLGLLQTIIDITPKIGETMLVLLFTLLSVITQAVPAIIQAGMDLLIAFLQGIADNIGRVVDSAVSIIVNFINGVARNLGRIIDAGVNLITKFMEGLAKAIPKVVDAAFKMVIDIANGIADAIRKNSQQLIDAGLNIVDAIIDGIVGGVKKLGGKAIDAVKGLGKSMINGVKDFLGINSPSKLFRDVVGMAIPEGIAVGIDKYSHLAENSTVSMGQTLLDTMGKTISGLGDMVGGMDEFNPVISPVLDLSAIQRDSSKIADLLGTAPIDLSNATVNASDASSGYAANVDALIEAIEAGSGTTVNMTQNNYSPKALSQADIYRNTNNQISRAKGALTNAN